MTTLPFIPPPAPLPPFSSPLYSPQTSVLDYFKLAAASHISTSLGVDLDKAYESIESGKTGKGANDGDFVVAVARFRLPKEQGTAQERAVECAGKLVPSVYLSSASAAGMFVTFTLTTSTLTSLVLSQINSHTYLLPATPPTSLTESFGSLDLSSSDDAESPSSITAPAPYKRGYGSNESGGGKKVVVEFSSPNIAKPFHAGHLRSTIIGAFLANLYEANGWTVLRMNYLGDWGKQFGILAVGFEKYGSEDALAKDAITHLYEVYVKINADGETDPTVHDRAREFFVGMENGDEKSLGLWNKFRALSIIKYRETYARLNIHFDLYSGESQVSHAAQKAAMDVLEKVGIAVESEGALIVDLGKWKLEKTIVRKKDGTYVYITRDIAGAKERWEKWAFEKMVYVVASQQDLHLKQFFKVLELMGYDWSSRLSHVNFGMVLGMSTRKGTAVFLEEILNESKLVMHEQMKLNEAKYNAVDDPEMTSDKLGITAVKIQDMQAKRVNNYKFEWARMTSFEGDTGPYLQYAHVRLSSIERKNAPLLVLPSPSLRPSTISHSLLTEPKARDIVVLLASYPDVVRQALKSLEPSTVVTFCFRLTHAISSAWEVVIVKGQERETAMARLWLYVCARDVLASAMRLLTLEPLEKM